MAIFQLAALSQLGLELALFGDVPALDTGHTIPWIWTDLREIFPEFGLNTQCCQLS